jgi:hypothetical protein
MKILAIERAASGSGRALSPSLLRAEAKRVWDLRATGVIREVYFRSDRKEAVLMLECSSVEEGNAVLSTLPLVEAGAIAFEIIPLAAYTGFSRLFADDVSPN